MSESNDDEITRFSVIKTKATNEIKKQLKDFNRGQGTIPANIDKINNFFSNSGKNNGTNSNKLSLKNSPLLSPRHLFSTEKETDLTYADNKSWDLDDGDINEFNTEEEEYTWRPTV